MMELQTGLLTWLALGLAYVLGYATGRCRRQASAVEQWKRQAEEIAKR